MGPNRHALTFPVNHGETLNLVAFVTSDEDWPSDVNLTLPATREDALKDFAAFGPNVQMLIKMTKEKPERVSSQTPWRLPKKVGRSILSEH